MAIFSFLLFPKTDFPIDEANIPHFNAPVLYRYDKNVYTMRMNPKNQQARFLAKIGDWSNIHRLLDLLPDVGFFIKDSHGRFMLNNQRACQFCNADNEQQTIGKTDYDFFDKDRADFYVQGDKEVMKSGIPVINQIAPAPEQSDRLMVHSKFPLYDKRGKAIGVVGFHRIVDEMRGMPQWYGSFAKVVAHIHENYDQNMDVRAMAKLAEVSLSQFERRFAKVLGVSPYEYLMRVRVTAARKMLESTSRTISDIACECGFYDHSHFTRIFKRIVGISPGCYRKHHPSSSG